jgi:hypothetical protein
MDKAKIDKMSGTSFISSMTRDNDILTACPDEQIAQMYELMQAIRKQELEASEADFQAPGQDAPKQD